MSKRRENAVDAAQVYYHFTSNHTQVLVPAPPYRGAFGGLRRIRLSNCQCSFSPGLVISSTLRHEIEEEATRLLRLHEFLPLVSQLQPAQPPYFLYVGQLNLLF
uniref:Uncharacterized protein n=1 Tax=Schistocephalus solidus TaxID=70667 RepID=A0A0X3Q4Q5_SCHSO